MPTSEIAPGEYLVWASYSLKVKPNPDSFAMHEVSIGLTTRVETDPETQPEKQLMHLETAEARLLHHLKYGVAAELGIEMETDKDGIVLPEIKADAAATRSSGGSSGGGGGGGYRSGGGGSSPIHGMKKFDADFGEGKREYYDCRPLKDDGTYKPRAADFRSVDKHGDDYHPVWLVGKNGRQQRWVVEALEEAGLST